MVKLSTNNVAEQTDNNTHKVYVEGVFDALIVREILKKINFLHPVYHLGGSKIVKGVSNVLLKNHNNCHFIIDRDHHEDNEVNQSWENFTGIDGGVIIWKKREIENYFLDAHYLCNAIGLKPKQTTDSVHKKICTLAEQSFYMMAANKTIQEFRSLYFGTLKVHSEFSDYIKFKSKESSLDEIINTAKEMKENINLSTINSYDFEFNFLENYTYIKCDFPKKNGVWLDRIYAKNVLSQLGNQIFYNDQDKNKIFSDLISRVVTEEPEDFINLRKIFSHFLYNPRQMKT
ncbi:MAG: hypothetical protein QM537_06875 [Candidatus Symbiobacter sp.]|nr:hypothetical protein [Candidatus Symbiobacter sp.]